MAQPIPLTSDDTAFIARLDRVVTAAEPATICEGVKQALVDLVLYREQDVPHALLEAHPQGYARRLLHRCPEGIYSVMVMVWGPGQGTPVHDHAGRWCVECVLRGEIEVVNYEPHGDPSTDEVVRLVESGRERGRRGDVGMYVPPNEYHRISNPGAEVAVTVHVYAGEMLWCHAFHPREGGGYRRERCSLEYTD